MNQLNYRMNLFFLGLDQAKKMRNKGISVKLLWPVMRWFEWTLVSVTLTLVWFLKVNGLADWEVFMVLWMGSMLISGSVYVSSDRSGIDLTLTEALRRLVEAALSNSKITGSIFATVVVLRLVIWDGSSCFVLFFKKYLDSAIKRAVAFFTISAVQMAIWTKISVFIYQNLIHLTNYLLASAN